jgi:hypothetical protein
MYKLAVAPEPAVALLWPLDWLQEEGWSGEHEEEEGLRRLPRTKHRRHLGCEPMGSLPVGTVGAYWSIGVQDTLSVTPSRHQASHSCLVLVHVRKLFFFFFFLPCFLDSTHFRQ